MAAFSCVVVLVLLAAPAFAHTQVESTTPSSGAVLDQSPPVARVRFDEAVQVRSDGVQLHDARGRRVDGGGVRRLDGGRTLELPLPELPDGGYVLTWRVVSDDGHPVSGGVTWRIGARATAVDPSVFQQLLDAEGGDTTLHAVAAVVQTLLFGGLVVLVGGLVFAVALWPAGLEERRLRWMLAGAAAVGALATVAGMGLHGADVEGLGLGRAASVRRVLDTLDESYGQAAAARLVLFGVLALLAVTATSRRAREMWWQVVVVAGGAATLLTITLAGHARSGRWLAIAAPVDLVHLGAGVTWLGGLALVAFVVLRRDLDGETYSVVSRFSAVALACVGALVLTGVLQGVRQLQGWGGLGDTGYGKLLVGKVAVVGVLLAVAATARSQLRRHDRAVVAGGAHEPAAIRRSLRRSVGAEAVLAVVVLAVTSLLVAANPARTTEERTVEVAKVVDGTVIEVVAVPARPGPVTFHLYVQDPSLGLNAQVGAEARLSLPAEHIPGITLPLQREGAAHFSAVSVEVPMRGTWRLEVTVTLGRSGARRAVFIVPVH